VGQGQANRWQSSGRATFAKATARTVGLDQCSPPRPRTWGGPNPGGNVDATMGSFTLPDAVDLSWPSRPPRIEVVLVVSRASSFRPCAVRRIHASCRSRGWTAQQSRPQDQGSSKPSTRRRTGGRGLTAAARRPAAGGRSRPPISSEPRCCEGVGAPKAQIPPHCLPVWVPLRRVADG